MSRTYTCPTSLCLSQLRPREWDTGLRPGLQGPRDLCGPECGCRGTLKTQHTWPKSRIGAVGNGGGVQGCGPRPGGPTVTQEALKAELKLWFGSQKRPMHISLKPLCARWWRGPKRKLLTRRPKEAPEVQGGPRRALGAACGQGGWPLPPPASAPPPSSPGPSRMFFAPYG